MGKHRSRFRLRSRWVRLLLFVVVMVAAVAATLSHLCGWFDSAARNPNTISVAEWCYYGRQIGRVIQNWQKIITHDPSARTGLKYPHRTCLVIDTNEPAIRIEDWAGVRRDASVRMPERAKWRLYDGTLPKGRPLSGLTRLRLKGTERTVSAGFQLVGTGAASRTLTIDFSGGAYPTIAVSSPGLGMLRSPVPWFGRPQMPGSLAVVTEDEYKRNMDLAKDSSEAGASRTESDRQIPSILRPNEARWLAAEGQAYLEVERQLSRRAYDLGSIAVNEGPGLTAGRVRAIGHRLSFWDKFYRGKVVNWATGYATLKYDYLGEDVWYFVSDPKLTGSRDKNLNLEFVVKAEAKLSRKQRNEWIKKGRALIKSSAAVPPSPWRVTLDNGISVELIGICSSPSDGRPWWGPDGSLLDYIPYYSTESFRLESDERAHEIAYEVTWPGGISSGYSSSVSDELRNNSGVASRDRYGDRADFRGTRSRHIFKQSTEKTTIMWVFGRRERERQYVEFKNISLVPGRDFGFEIGTGVRSRSD